MSNHVKLAYTILVVHKEEDKNTWSTEPNTENIKAFGSRIRSVIDKYDNIERIITQDPSVLSYALEAGKLPDRKNVIFRGKLPEDVELYYKLTE